MPSIVVSSLKTTKVCKLVTTKFDVNAFLPFLVAVYLEKMFTIGIIKSDVYAEGKADEITEKVNSVPDTFSKHS